MFLMMYYAMSLQMRDEPRVTLSSRLSFCSHGYYFPLTVYFSDSKSGWSAICKCKFTSKETCGYSEQRFRGYLEESNKILVCLLWNSAFNFSSESDNILHYQIENLLRLSRTQKRYSTLRRIGCLERNQLLWFASRNSAAIPLCRSFIKFFPHEWICQVWGSSKLLEAWRLPTKIKFTDDLEFA